MQSEKRAAKSATGEKGQDGPCPADAASANGPAGHSETSSSWGNFRSLILRAAGWSMGGYVASQLLRIVSNLILTRLLVPEMFGLMAIATMVQVIITMLSDIGLRQAVIQSAKGDAQDFLDTAWTLQAVRGFLIWLICIAVALAIDEGDYFGVFSAGSVYAAPELPAIIIAVAFTSVINGFQSTKLISCARHLDLGRVTALELFTQILGLIVAVVLAWMTRSIWSFVASALVSSIAFTILSHTHLTGRNNRFRLEPDSVNDLVRFGRWIMLSSTFSVLASNGDRVLLAGWISPTALGLYVLAFSLVAILEGAGSRLFTSVATPSLSRVVREQPEMLRSVYFKFRLPFDLFFVGGAGLLYGCGEAIIGLLYDARYAEASTVLQILSFSLLVARFGVSSFVYLAIGEPRYLSFLNIVKAFSLFTVAPLGYWLFGFEGALWAIAVHALPTLPMIFRYNRAHNLNSVPFELAVLLAWPLGYAVGRVATYVLDAIPTLGNHLF